MQSVCPRARRNVRALFKGVSEAMNFVFSFAAPRVPSCCAADLLKRGVRSKPLGGAACREVSSGQAFYVGASVPASNQSSRASQRTTSRAGRCVGPGPGGINL